MPRTGQLIVEAAAFLIGLPEGLPGFEGFDTGIDKGVTGGFVPSPGGDEAPAHEFDGGFGVFQKDDGGQLRGGDVVARGKKGDADDEADELDQLGEILCGGVSSTHDGGNIHRTVGHLQSKWGELGLLDHGQRTTGPPTTDNGHFKTLKTGRGSSVESGATGAKAEC